MESSRLLTLIGVLCATSIARAQDPQLAEIDLIYSRTWVESSRFVAQIKVQTGSDRFERYTCEHYPHRAQITTSDGVVYAHWEDQPWMQSRDWGRTGTEVSEEQAAKLDIDVERTLLPWVFTTKHDKAQGGFVWKLFGQFKKDNNEYFTYERSRAFPRPDGFYPLYTFVKYQGEIDGRLLLQTYTAQVYGGEELTPVEVTYDFGVE